MSVELIAAILTWTGIGWLVDQWLGTMPWLMVTGALVGNSAGLYLIWLRGERAIEADRRQRARSRAADGKPRSGDEGGSRLAKD